MLTTPKYTDLLSSIKDEHSFNETALRLFRFQAEHIPVYRSFVNHLGVDPLKIQSYRSIPFLPIEVFKSHEVLKQGLKPALIFESSGTTQGNTSQHFVADESLYEWSYEQGFKRFYGGDFNLEGSQMTILALLPGYLERQNSSLVRMVKGLIDQHGDDQSGFFLDEWERLAAILKQNSQSKKPTLLIGVTFALIDFAEQFPVSFPELVVMETGGMKGRRKEMLRDEVHSILRKGFNVEQVHSEYGMTELLSQAYSKGEGIFEMPPWMKVLIREVTDPLSGAKMGKSGGVNVIDLANRDSCAFIATSDLGKLHTHERFEILGRFDHSDVRGCNLMVQ